MGVLRAPSAAAAVGVGLAAIRGGLQVLELTFTTPKAPDAIKELRAALPPGVLLGAGTIMSAEDARTAVAAGAAFLVSPHLDEDVLNTACDLRVPYLQGVLTPTEVVRAHRLGAAVVKLFPIRAVGGTTYLKDLRGPLPAVQAMVTGGVVPEEVPAYLAAGALAVGLGSSLFPSAALESDSWDAVQRATRGALHKAGVPT